MNWRPLLGALGLSALLGGCAGHSPLPAIPQNVASVQRSLKPMVNSVGWANNLWVVDGQTLKEYPVAAAGTLNLTAVASVQLPTSPSGRIAMQQDGNGVTTDVVYGDGAHHQLIFCTFNPGDTSCKTQSVDTNSFLSGVTDVIATNGIATTGASGASTNSNLQIVALVPGSSTKFLTFPVGQFGWSGTVPGNSFSRSLALPVHIAMDSFATSFWSYATTGGSASLLSFSGGDFENVTAEQSLAEAVDVNENEQMWTGNNGGTLAETNLYTNQVMSYQPGGGRFSVVSNTLGIASDKQNAYVLGPYSNGAGFAIETYSDNAATQTPPSSIILDSGLKQPSAIAAIPAPGFSQFSGCNNTQFLNDQAKLAAGTISGYQHEYVCGVVTSVDPTQHCTTYCHGWWWIETPSGYQIKIVSNLNAMAEASTNKPPSTWPWVKIGDYGYATGRYYYDNASSQGMDWTEDDTGSWPYVGWVGVCEGTLCNKYW